MKKGRKPIKSRTKKRSTIANYIEEVCDYEARYERDGGGEYSYPPIVPKLLLSILICLKPLTSFILSGAGLLLGLLAAFLLKQLFILG